MGDDSTSQLRDIEAPLGQGDKRHAPALRGRVRSTSAASVMGHTDRLKIAGTLERLKRVVDVADGGFRSVGCAADAQIAPNRSAPGALERRGALRSQASVNIERVMSRFMESLPSDPEDVSLDAGIDASASEFGVLETLVQERQEVSSDSNRGCGQRNRLVDVPSGSHPLLAVDWREGRSLFQEGEESAIPEIDEDVPDVSAVLTSRPDPGRWPSVERHGAGF